MQKKYTSLGLMSGTSGDGVDASVLYSDGINKYEVIKDKYFAYDRHIYQNIHGLKEKIFNIKDIKKLSDEISELERKITLFHAKIIKEFNSQNFCMNLKEACIPCSDHCTSFSGGLSERINHLTESAPY